MQLKPWDRVFLCLIIGEILLVALAVALHHA